MGEFQSLEVLVLGKHCAMDRVRTFDVVAIREPYGIAVVVAAVQVIPERA